ncbi:MAG: tagatose 1,6-diphosphate aldolase [Deinococcales bacterium]
MSEAVSAGKLRGLMTLADDDGVFRMVAVDQRPPLFAALTRHDGRDPGKLDFEEVARAKGLLTRVLAPEAGAILIDPVWTHATALQHVPGTTGLISTLEDYGFDEAGGERRSRRIEGWDVAAVKRSGASGVKLLAWYRPDASDATCAHQEALVQAVGEACRASDIPFVLELLVYPLPGEDATSTAYQEARPERVIESVRRFADPRFGVDVYKLEFPADLKYCRGYHGGAFDGRERPPLFTLDDVRAILTRLDEATPAPWVLLSAGVGPAEFEVDLELAFEAGASGFLAGRAVWLRAFDAYPDVAEVERRLRTAALPYLRAISARASAALPWTAHRRFAGAPRMDAGGDGWHRRYGS